MPIDVAQWLRGLGLEQYAPVFHDNDIDAEILPELTAEDLTGLAIASIGHRRKLLAAIAALREGPAEPAPSEPADKSAVERRQLTIMFCDVVGSTELATRLDPEDLREVIGAYHRCVAEVLGRFGGFVAKYMGDGVLAYFGYPQAHEDDSERAVRAGLAIVGAVGLLDLSHRLRVRLGLATGLVVVGDLLGAGAAQEQAVVGETPNLAARLQAIAEPDGIVIADATRRQIGGLFELRDLGRRELKGFAGMPQTWQVVGESGVASRFEALRSRETPLVGRDEEIDLLLRRWTQAKSGDGRAVLISAEPGIGKSRLTEALEERIAADPHRRLRYFCSPHHQDSALYPIIGQLERAAGFVREDDDATRLHKLGDLTGPDLPLFADLLALPGAPAAQQLTPQRKKDLVFDALMRALDTLARQQPLLMVFEDLHWMDPSSRELLDRTIARVEHLPVLLIATFRPEFQPPWAGQAHVTMLALSRLGRREGAALVRQLAANAAALPADIIDQIIERTDGVPLFLEEVTKVVLEAEEIAARGAVAAIPGARAAVPATLQASLMARLDRLGAAAREIAQAGAAIGRDFAYDLAVAAAPRAETETRAGLDLLVGAGLLFQRGAPPNAEYQFKHALVQDTAYGSLLRGPRQALHGRIAAAIEARGPEQADREPEVLAFHLGEAGESERAATYWQKAGRLAVRRAANREAIGHFRRALALVEARPDSTERGQAELAILTQLAPPLMAMQGWSAPEVGEVVERAEALGRRLPSSPELAPAVANLWIFNIATGRGDRAHQISADLFRIARDLGDDEVLLQAHHSAWATEFFDGHFHTVLEHAETGRALYDPERHAHHRHVYLGHDPAVCSCNFAMVANAALGYHDRSKQFHDEGIARARQLGHAPSHANTLWRRCELAAIYRDVAAVQPMAREMLDLTEAHGLRLPQQMARCYVGWALALSGSIAEGIAEIELGIGTLAGLGARMNASAMLGLYAEALSAMGRHAEGLAHITEGLAVGAAAGESSYDSWLYRLRGELLLHLNGAADPACETALREGLAVARRQEARGFELTLALPLARLNVARENRDAARDVLAPLCDWFTEGLDLSDLVAAKALLASLG
ncbi:MAG TPA: AAA family ATPase [Stellaceae bacterium]|jgi:class 3 adenylate cyclase/tetratricopeptide (TPR) repeat protein|nr:AAA family ATPase [Stellaceae bacterium]